MTTCRYCATNETDLLSQGRQIIVECAVEHGVTYADIVGPSRQHDFVAARSCSIRRLRAELGLPLKTIGLLLGYRDHSTIIYHLKKGRA